MHRGDSVELPHAAPFAGLYLVQPFVPNDGTDHKLYVIGDRMSSLLKPSPLLAGHLSSGAVFAVPDDLTRLRSPPDAPAGSTWQVWTWCSVRTDRSSWTSTPSRDTAACRGPPRRWPTS